MDRWEEKRIDRLEDRVAELERKNWDRSTFWFNLAVYGMVTAFLVFTAVVIALDASGS